MVDIADTNAGAALIPLPDLFAPTGTRYSEASGTLEFVGDVDRWKIHLDLGDTITVMANMAVGVSTQDVEVRLLKADGTVLQSNNDESAGLTDSLLNLTILSSGDYYIQVLEHSGLSVGNYTLDVLLRAPGENFTADFGTIAPDSGAIAPSVPGGGSSNNTWRGSDGNDAVTLTTNGVGEGYLYATGDAGNDLIFGNDLGNVLFGGYGDDTLVGGAGVNALLGGDGNDFLNNTAGAAGGKLYGGNGDDTLYAFSHAAQEFGGPGNDVILGGDEGDLIDGGPGDDTMFARSGAGGSPGNDHFIVDSLGDVVYEFPSDGIDLVESSVNVDLTDATRFQGEIENILLSSVKGAATIAIGNGLANQITGNTLADTLDGRGGADTTIGLGGNDRYVVDNTLDTVSEAGGSGIDTIVSSVTFSLVASAHVIGAVENLTLGAGSLNGTGNALANMITGGSGANILIGGSGNDTLIGGAGIDHLTGGPGSDFFVFNAPLSAANRDIISDFSHAADTFRLENAVMKALGAAGALKPNFFFAGAAAHDADDHVIYNQATGVLSYDSNGNAAGGVTQLATLTNKPVLLANDFVVI